MLKKIIITLLCGFAGFLLSLPALFTGAFGVPGNCSTSLGYCTLWFALMLAAAAPFHLGILTVVLTLGNARNSIILVLRYLMVLLPAGTSALVLSFLFSGNT
jgi:hypothetical protein